MPQTLKCVILQVSGCGKSRRAGRLRTRGSSHGLGLVGKAINQDMDV